MCKHGIIISIIISFFVHSAYAQITTGGNIGVNVVNNVLIIDFAPEIGYEIIDNASAGFSPFVVFAQNFQSNASNTIFGARIFTEYKIDLGIFAHAEYEISSSVTSEGLSKVTHAAPIGGGYETEIATNTVAYIMVLYDVLYKVDFSYRTNPIIRAGVRYSF